jgi:hypothetical protein
MNTTEHKKAANDFLICRFSVIYSLRKILFAGALFHHSPEPGEQYKNSDCGY